jgi:RNA polymerase sigma factor (sigma-70 family)
MRSLMIMTIDDIIKKYGNFIKSQIYQYDKDANFINDIYQKAIIKLWQIRPDTVNFKYLSKLVKFTIIDNYRRNKKVIKILPIEYFEFVSDDNADHLVVTKERVIVTELQSQRLLQKIDKLKDSQREVVLLRIAGYNFIQISKILNITHSYAINQMHYAKKNLIKK